MKPKRTVSKRMTSSTELRQRAEARLNEHTAAVENTSPDQVQHLPQELQIHQIELEMQNEELRHAQHELEASHEKYFDLYDLAPVGYLTLSEPGLILEANLTTAKLLGMDKSQLVKQPLTHFVVRDDLGIYDLHSRKLVATGKSQECELRIMKQGGSHFWTHLQISVAQNDEGAPVRRVMLNDITDRKRAEEQLKQLNLEFEQRVAEQTRQLEKSEAQQRTFADDLKAILEMVTDGISVTDVNGNFIAVNSAFARLYGYARNEDLLGKAAIELVAEQDRVRAFEYLHQMLQAGPISSCECQMVRRDGSEFLGEINVTPINDESNYSTRFVAITRDITQHKAAEEALWTSQEYARNIIDSSLDMIIAVDMDRRITEFNKAAEETFGYRREQVLGESINLLYADLVESGSVHARTMLKGRTVNQILNKTKNGRIFPSLLAASVLRDLHGTPIGFMGISREITELIRAEEEQTRLFDQVRAGRERLQLLSKQLLDAQESERRHIARELHDEIGQAMTGVQMNLQIIEPFLIDASAKTRLEDTTLTIERMLQQIRNLSLDLRPSLLDDFGLVPALRWLLERQAQRTGLDIQFSADPLEKRAREQIETACFRVTQEAITNITRHARARHVTVQLSGSQSDLQLTIQDDGIGFDVTEAVKRAAQGSSMGLLGLQERVILVGGKVEISSAPNQGTRIHVIIPFNGSTAHKDRRSKPRTGNETNSHSVS